jgi:hypothetical protein
MSSPLSTDLKEAIAYIVALMLIAAPVVWYFWYPSIEPPATLIQWATFAIQFLFGIAGSAIAIRSYRIARIEAENK